MHIFQPPERISRLNFGLELELVGNSVLCGDGRSVGTIVVDSLGSEYGKEITTS